jgi:hypothetical protein
MLELSLPTDVALMLLLVLRTTGEWRKLYLVEFHNLVSSSSSIITTVIASRMN